MRSAGFAQKRSSLQCARESEIACWLQSVPRGSEIVVRHNLELIHSDAVLRVTGGAVFAIQGALGLPVRYVGTGEQLELLEVFEPEAFVDAIVSRTAPAGAADEA